MAQQDTGLGWSAKSEYLMSAAAALIGNLAKYAATGYPNQPLAYCPTEADVHSLGLYVGESGNQSQAAGRAIWLGCGDVEAFVFVSTYTSGSGGKHFGIYSSVETVTLNWATKRYNDWYRFGTVEQTGTYDSTTGLYFSVWNYSSTGITTYSADVIPIADVGTVIVAAETPYYKLNSGYAVVVLAKWLSLAGDTITTPVLISSERENVKLSTDGSTEVSDQMIASYLYDGILFYMNFLNLRDYSFSSPNVPICDLTQFAAAQPKKVFQILITESYANVLVSSAPDPYENQDGASEEDGGDGNDIDDEPVLNDTHTVPTGGGFYKIFTPSLYQLGQLSQYMWGTLDLDNFKRIFSSPIDCILGLGIVPISLTGTNSPVYLGGIDTQLSFPLVTDEVYDFDMGSVHIEKATGSYLDYAPYTKISVYLPFIGFRELDTDDVMDEYITLKYRIDIATGACIARLSRMGTTLYQFSGSCLKQLPITGTNWDNAITGAISTAVSIGSTVASAGASAPVLAGAVASATTQALTTKSNAQRSGSLSATSGLLGGVVPYIVRTTPKEVIPANQNKYIGYPSYTTQSLGSLSGYNEIASIHLEGIPATGGELAEIETLLKGGVIL